MTTAVGGGDVAEASGVLVVGAAVAGTVAAGVCVWGTAEGDAIAGAEGETLGGSVASTNVNPWDFGALPPFPDTSPTTSSAPRTKAATTDLPCQVSASQS
jgi:hypothetical protein